jgi:hypothetical protein
VGTSVNFNNATRAPLLLISGDKDHTIEPSMVKATHRKYQQSRAVTVFKSFPNRTHWLIAAPGWEEIADYAIMWASEQEYRSMSGDRGTESLGSRQRVASA